jgi:hypothetical protein
MIEKVSKIQPSNKKSSFNIDTKIDDVEGILFKNN